MISRRYAIQAVAGICCAAHAGNIALAQDPDRAAFVCATIEPPGDLSIPVGLSSESLTPYGTGFVSERWHVHHGLTPESGIITLGVHFMNGSEENKNLVRRTAVKWQQGKLAGKLAFRFDVERADSSIRIIFASQGNWSYVGKGNRNIQYASPTMCLQNVTERVILHEFGHAIGLQHEHMNPATPFTWNEEVIYQEMAQFGWSRQVTRRNIIERYGRNAACVGDPKFNPDSIMLYPIPAHWTKEGISFGTNSRISVRDEACVRGLYLG